MLNGLILLFVKFKIENARRADQLLLERQEKEQIKELNNQKLQFFTNISHEFRTPVTLISGPIKDILNDPSISVPLKRKARIIEKNSDKMIYLIDELITFRELGLGLLELKPKPLDIAQFIAETIEYFQLFAEKKEVIISCQSFLANNIIMADPMQLYKVLNNLIANALKFCPFNSVVKVEIDRVKKRNLTVESRKTDSDWISISVRDQGAGIPKEHILNLFERFYKGEDRQSGTGIGLSLAKEIVELHKGYLEVESEPGNTNFIVYLPKGQPEKAQNQLLAGVAPYHEKLKPESLLIHETLELDESYGIDLGNFDKKDILLVEDNNELLQYLLMLLKDEFNVATASNGIEGLLQLDKKTPHAIVTDVVMPKMDGFKFCEKIKNDPKTSHIPLILLTAKTMTNDKIKGLELGADDYLDKPFNPEILKARIHMLIKNRENLIEIINSDATIDFSKLAKNPIDEKFMRKAIGYIHENLDNEEFSVEQFSDQMAMSRSNLFRRIKIITKMSPVDFIYHIRLQVSMKLLIERKLSVSEIAWKVGFKNPSSFSKSFKKQFGKSPSGYLNDLLKR
jgi:DNA-binding response OmpR family regulator/nitrogen-specific signal transduction histidine kinase